MKCQFDIMQTMLEMGLHKFKKNMTGGLYCNIAKMITLLVKLLDRCLAACD